MEFLHQSCLLVVTYVRTYVLAYLLAYLLTVALRGGASGEERNGMVGIRVLYD